MPQQDPYGFSLDHALLEAEVAPNMQAAFRDRYFAATSITITPGSPPEFQGQKNKWGAECRIYFNSDATEIQARSHGFHVEVGQPYHNDYKYRINNVDLWWTLVEDYDFRLGIN